MRGGLLKRRPRTALDDDASDGHIRMPGRGPCEGLTQPPLRPLLMGKPGLVEGVNDGPALRRADIGVAMGRRGTEVARQAADLVLADDNLATVVSAVEEGRRIYANVRRYLLYALAGGTAENLVMLIGPFMGLALPLLPAQILWINLLTHGLPGVALRRAGRVRHHAASGAPS